MSAPDGDLHESGAPPLPAEPVVAVGQGGGRPSAPTSLNSLQFRLALPYVVLTLLVLCGVAIFVGERAEDITLDGLAVALEDQGVIVADQVQRQLSAGASAAQIDALVDQLGQRTEVRITVVAADGTVLGDSAAEPLTMETHGARPEVIAARAEGVGRTIRRSATIGEELLYVAVVLPDGSGNVVRLARPLTEVTAAVDRAQSVILVTALAAALLVIAIAWFLAGRLARPLVQLRQQAVAVAAGDLSAQVDPSATRELGDVGRAFNSMTRALRRSQTALQRQRTRFEAILEELNDGVVLTDDDGTVIRINGAAAALFTTDERSAVGKPFIQVCRDHELAALLATALAGEQRQPVAVEHGLNRRTLLTSAQRIDGGDERLGLVVLRDISDLRRLEGVRRDFVANVSHELRTPLASIRALVETLEAGAIDDSAVAGDFLHRIVGEVDRLTALVEDLLDLARLEADRAPLQLVNVDISTLIERVLERLRPQIADARLSVGVEVEPGLPSLEADGAKIEQVLVNLIHNAIKFTPPGGTITVGARHVRRRLEISVSDTGVGIPAEDLPRLFERFYKSDKARRSGGTGLGLAIAKHIVQAHGGTIWAESQPGHGSKFSFSVPFASPAPSQFASEQVGA
ncbi:MAG: ATP-binding protein [Chloroflexota bacterium]|nr:ATP-binding protein [Chloroflexota bacterium]